MSLVERFYPANFILNRVVIIHFHSWHFVVFSYKKNSFDSVRSRFSRVIANMRDRKKHFRHILLFYYRKSKNGVHTRKKLRKVWRKCINGCHAGVKIGFQNFVPVISTLHVSGRQIEIDEDKIKMYRRSKATNNDSRKGYEIEFEFYFSRETTC